MAFINFNELEFDTSSGKARIQIDRRPNICPICDHRIDPIFLRADDSTVSFIRPSSKLVEVILKCARPECNRTFISQYENKTVRNESANHKPIYTLMKLIPNTEIHLEIDDNIKKISPKFYDIYYQSLIAESHGLSDICGSGYRKSLEFIIKDFCVYIFPDKSEEIKNNDSLMQSIKRIDSPDILDCASRAAWIGNDQVHYKKLHENEDVETLKSLIELTIYAIKMKVMHNELVNRITKKK